MKTIKIVMFLLLLVVLSCPAMAGNNLLSNPSFEDGTTLATHWTEYRETAGEPTYSLVTSRGSLDGTKCQKIEYNGVAGDAGAGMIDIYQTPITCRPGDNLTFSVYLNGSLIDTTAEITIDSYTAGDVLLTEEHTAVPLTADPVKYTVQYVAPATADHVRASIIFAGISATSKIYAEADCALLTRNEFKTDLRPGTSHRAPLTINFTDNHPGTPTSYLWDFGDGVTSTDKNPQHTFTKMGSYNVTETVTTGEETQVAQLYVFVTSPANLLQNPGFEYNTPIASPWDSELEYLEHDAVYYHVPAIDENGGVYAQTMTFTGWPVEPEANKVEIFQSIYGTTPEENLTFSIWLKGDPSNTRVIIGIETFESTGDPLAGGRIWITEEDKVITVDNTWKEYSVNYKMLPGTDSAAVYVHFNQINPATRMSITMDNAVVRDNDYVVPVEETADRAEKTAATETASNTMVTVMGILGAIALLIAAGALITAVKGNMSPQKITAMVLGLIIFIAVAVVACIVVSFIVGAV